MSSGADSGDESLHVVAELATSGDNASTSIAAASATIAASVTSDAEGELPSDSSLAAEERKHHDTKSKRRQANPVARRPKPVPDPTHTQAILAALDRDPVRSAVDESCVHHHQKAVPMAERSYLCCSPMLRPFGFWPGTGLCPMRFGGASGLC